MYSDEGVEVVHSCGAVVSLGSHAEAFHGAVVVVRGKHHLYMWVELGSTSMEECVPGKVWVAGSGGEDS